MSDRIARIWSYTFPRPYNTRCKRYQWEKVKRALIYPYSLYNIVYLACMRNWIVIARAHNYINTTMYAYSCVYIRAPSVAKRN